MHPPASRHRTAFTLIELLVVVAIIALLIAILLPSLGRAREQTKLVKCQSNLGQWGKAIIVYTAENNDYLPGDSHPAIFRWQGIEAMTDPKNGALTMPLGTAQQQQKRFISYKLRRQLGDSDGSKKSVADEIGTCPTLAGIVPDQHWINHAAQTGKRAYPTHYSLNNWGPGTADEGPTGSVNNPRTTEPAHYFGLSDYSDNQDKERVHPPKALTKIKRPSEEWAVADAWWRRNASLPQSPYYQQDGPYQSEWSGTAMPNFAPHFAKRSSYTFEGDAAREADSSQIRIGRQDGKTPAVYFDGHSDAPASQRCISPAAEGDLEILYGFKGTVNMPCPRFPYVPNIPCDSPDNPGVIPYWQ